MWSVIIQTHEAKNRKKQSTEGGMNRIVADGRSDYTSTRVCSIMGSPRWCIGLQFYIYRCVSIYTDSSDYA